MGAKLDAPPAYVLEWFDSGLTSGQIALKQGRNPGTVRSLMRYWKKRMVQMANLENCWVKTAHRDHGWTEVIDRQGDAKIVSMGSDPGSEDASTVYQAPEGSQVKHHHCMGVDDLSEETSHLRRVEPSRQYEQLYIVREREGSQAGMRVTVQRRVTLEAVYERTVTAMPWEEVQRLDCWCCTCDERPGSDAACRNHGYYGKRPCEQHGTEGYFWEDTDEMPESVQAYRANRAVDAGTAD